ncbi:hypothetical protein BDB00DRAFT_878112 [Zychaea mexicana]|uniref:uncharacterized protein n=1 Tax=Zychaea mexicana TaxID=64656 RepID=UPI0022FE81DE|nr:uncharacterized protein BDB00DRAFT_878112 [Zychaea mexicana]KAI9485005.1 hypothetical protein BDB00DRAFT_878112 [Zychaea mexicana]
MVSYYLPRNLEQRRLIQTVHLTLERIPYDIQNAVQNLFAQYTRQYGARGVVIPNEDVFGHHIVLLDVIVKRWAVYFQRFVNQAVAATGQQFSFAEILGFYFQLDNNDVVLQGGVSAWKQGAWSPPTGYRKDLAKTIVDIQGNVHPRYTFAQLNTNGVKLSYTVRDWNKAKGHTGQRFKFLPEIRKYRRRFLEEHGLLEDADLSLYYQAVIGVDLGRRPTPVIPSDHTGEHHGSGSSSSSSIASVTTLQTESVLSIGGEDVVMASPEPGEGHLGDDTHPGVQFAVSSSELHGRNRQNKRWLQRRKQVQGIHELEARLSFGSTKSTYQNALQYIRQWQNNNTGLALNTFNSQKAVLHKQWDTRISISSAFDHACGRALNLSRISATAATRADCFNHINQRKERRREEEQRQLQHHAPRSIDRGGRRVPRDELQLTRRHRQAVRRQQKRLDRLRTNTDRRIMIGLGLDGMIQQTPLGELASMDTKLANRLMINTQARNNVDVVRLDEYNTSQFCPNCTQNGQQSRLHYLRRNNNNNICGSSSVTLVESTNIEMEVPLIIKVTVSLLSCKMVADHPSLSDLQGGFEIHAKASLFFYCPLNNRFVS